MLGVHPADLVEVRVDEEIRIVRSLPLSVRGPRARRSMAAHLVRDPLHTTLMPPIPRTRSLYELPKRDSQDYRFRNTVAFWIAVSFVEGSLLFICGALASALALREAWKQRGLVEFAYFAGSLFYTLGSYLGFFQVINLGRDRIRLFACSGTSREAYWGSLLYLAGALFFNVGCVEGLLPAAVQTPRLFWGLYYTPFVAGTACKLELAVLGAPQLATLASWGWHGWLWVCAPHLGGAASPRHAEPSGRPRHGRYAPRPKWRDSAAPSIQAPRASCWAR